MARYLKPGDVVLLEGELGAGKTCFAQGIGKGLRVAEAVKSSSFVLVNEYNGRLKVYHADLYRIESFHDFETLGLEDMFAVPAVAILEWSEKFPLPSPWPMVRVRLEHLGGDSRRISVSDSV